MQGIALTLMAAPVSAEVASWSVESPSGELSATVTLDPERSPSLRYEVQLSGAAVIAESPLGLERDDHRFIDGLRLILAEPPRAISESYTLLHGKRKECAHHANELALTLRNGAGARLVLRFRASDDGVAFRYEFPETDGETKSVLGEASGFRIPDGAKAWTQPMTKPTIWGPSYERTYTNGDLPAAAASSESLWCFPALFQVGGPDRWVLLTEAGLDGSFAGCGLSTAGGDGVYRVRLPLAEEGIGIGNVSPQSTLPWKTPWRVAVIGDLGAILETTLITDLSDPCRVEDTSWVRPGRVAWSWWSDNDSPQDYNRLEDFVDFAAEMGWEYSLVDANWTLMRGGDIEQLAEYAADKGVKLLLWYNSGGDHNSVFEKPRGAMNDRRVRRHEFELLRSWGVAGVKVDFFHSDKQDRIAQYLGILEDAADYGLLVNFHGCTIPRGWSRTYPHMMTMEAVQGAESYSFIETFPSTAATQSTILPFTRNTIGPMDYTPVTWSPRKYESLTTMAHELSLSITFESPLQHFADSDEAYRNAPESVREWLREVPTVWDDTRYLGGVPGQWVAIARRSGDVWYVGVTNNDTARTAVIDLSPLGANDAKVYRIIDGDNENRVLASTASMTPDGVTVSLRPHGGAVLRLQR